MWIRLGLGRLAARTFLGAVAGLSLVLLGPIEVRAQNYAWCAQYGGEHGGRNCGFSTFEQCRATLSGNGGYCSQNALYRPEPSTTYRKSRR